MPDVYCVDCGIWIDGDGYISDNGIGPLCEDCNEIARMHKQAETELECMTDDHDPR